MWTPIPKPTTHPRTQPILSSHTQQNLLAENGRMAEWLRRVVRSILPPPTHQKTIILTALFVDSSYDIYQYSWTCWNKTSVWCILMDFVRRGSNPLPFIHILWDEEDFFFGLFWVFKQGSGSGSGRKKERVVKQTDTSHSLVMKMKMKMSIMNALVSCYDLLDESRSLYNRSF